MLRPVCHLVSASAGGEEWVVGWVTSCSGSGAGLRAGDHLQQPPSWQEGII